MAKTDGLTIENAKKIAHLNVAIEIANDFSATQMARIQKVLIEKHAKTEEYCRSFFMRWGNFPVEHKKRGRKATPVAEGQATS